jgi:Tfp pilus assembly protein PilF
MNFSRQLFFCVAVVFSASAVATACLWDSDTLQQERSRFPSALELVTGKFLRHSPEFYEWRIQDRLEKLKADPKNMALHDDLAVAYEKTGQHALAIKTVSAKEEIQPGLYETYSNLGTFHILAGDFELGLPFIDKALEINPDAHFGRERYQKWLVEYAMTRLTDGELRFPLRQSIESAKENNVATDFRAFLCQKLGTEQLTFEESQKAVKGVLGMMRFANHRNPLLLEALGDLLVNLNAFETPKDAKNLATRCYLKASYEFSNDEATQQRYRALAERALQMQTSATNPFVQLELVDLEKEFQGQLDDAEKWYAELKNREIGWIQAKLDADAEFNRLYTEEPAVRGSALEHVMNRESQFHLAVGVAIAAISLAVVLAVRQRSRTKASPPNLTNS